MPSSEQRAIDPARSEDLAESLRPRLAVEAHFERSGRTFRKSRFRLWFNRKVKAAALEALFKAAGLYRRGVLNALSPVVHRIELDFEDLPAAFDGFEIVHLSDFHIDAMDGLAEALAPVLKDLRPDLYVLTGDYRFEIRGSCEEVYRRMKIVFSAMAARYGTVGILGNHDAAEIATRFEEMGVRMLVNEAIELQRGASSLWLIGVDDSFDYRCADLRRATCAISNGGFRILLSHSPELYREGEHWGVNLYLCGHTHAGQVRLPLIGAVKKNAPIPRALIQGQWAYKSMQGYTSWGVGCSTLPVRYNCPAEVAVIRLRKKR